MVSPGTVVIPTPGSERGDPGHQQMCDNSDSYQLIMFKYCQNYLMLFLKNYLYSTAQLPVQQMTQVDDRKMSC